MPSLDLNNLKNIKNFELIPEWNFFVDFFPTISELYHNLVKYCQENPLDEKAYDIVVEITDNLWLDKVEELSFSVKAINDPEVTVVGMDVNLGGSMVNIADKLQLGNANTLTIDFYATTSNIAYKLYYLWISIMTDFEEDYKRPRGVYEVPIDIYIFNRQNQQITYKRYNDCSPRSVTDKKFDMLSTKYLDARQFSFRVNGGVEIDFT